MALQSKLQSVDSPYVGTVLILYLACNGDNRTAKTFLPPVDVGADKLATLFGEE